MGFATEEVQVEFYMQSRVVRMGIPYSRCVDVAPQLTITYG